MAQAQLNDPSDFIEEVTWLYETRPPDPDETSCSHEQLSLSPPPRSLPRSPLRSPCISPSLPQLVSSEDLELEDKEDSIPEQPSISLSPPRATGCLNEKITKMKKKKTAFLSKNSLSSLVNASLKE